MSQSKYGKLISDSQCFHWCPKQADREGHDWCHYIKQHGQSKLDNWVKLCPLHRQDFDDIT
jgi:hypothetical protein